MARSGGRDYIRCMETLVHFAVPVALFAVAATLGVGIYSLFRGGDFSRSHSNKLMRLRVAFQFVAVIVLMTAFWFRFGAPNW